MKHYLEWKGNRKGETEWFPASVPGNIQKDYGEYRQWPDIYYGKNVEMYEALEEDTWVYRTEFTLKPKEGESLWFVSHGIDYECEIYLNGTLLGKHEGAYEQVEYCLNDYLKESNVLEVVILPHPLAPDAKRGDGRAEAHHVVKPPVCYEWDWHPRLLNSGIIDDTYLEIATPGTVTHCECFYTLNEDRTSAAVRFDIRSGKPATIRFEDEEGNVLYEGTDKEFTLDNIHLWWCNGQGEPYLYRYTVFTDEDSVSRRVGFRTVALVMNEGGWNVPNFPKSRSNPPTTVCLNGRNIFIKGSNWVRPYLFPGTVTEEMIRPEIQLAKDANMNFFRLWGGSGFNKEFFYDICDELGIMIWQEFPLACNLYPDEPHYLEILKQEASYMVKELRQHPCMMLWCGGNELFNGWSQMTDQSLPLRLLNAVCLELDPHTPFNYTSPLAGMAHGGYTFIDYESGLDCFANFQRCNNTAYTEFGCPSMADEEYLKTFIPENELDLIIKDPCWEKHRGHYMPPVDENAPRLYGSSWEKHHAVNVWRKESWSHVDQVEHYFGEMESLGALCYYTQWMQCEGYKAIFEEARRQWPVCAMASNWCYNEPWPNAANNSLLSFPARTKPGYFAVRDALRPVMPSARIPKFDWKPGELFRAELWMLNGSPEVIEDEITALLILENEEVELFRWKAGTLEPNTNRQGHWLQYKLPEMKQEYFVLKLLSAHGNSEYKLCFHPNAEKISAYKPGELQRG